MSLSTELVSQFVKVTNDNPNNKKNETTVYGTIVEFNEKNYVKLDGSDLLTPISSTTNIKAGDRVTVMIKNHTATVTGNISSPSAITSDISGIQSSIDKISEFEIIISGKVDTDELNAQVSRIDKLQTDVADVKETLTANEATISELNTEVANVKTQLTANTADIGTLKTDKLDASIAEATYATITNLEATNTKVNSLESTYAEFQVTTTNKLTAVDADILDLQTNKLSATDIEGKYANIDFSNIGKAAMEYLYSQSGLIENVTIEDGTITGNLVGVTIKGDIIEGNTVVADKLVIQGEDGLYYKLNTDGVTTELEQNEYNSLNGSVILAKSITAEKVSVSDLVAFDATIGGFNITENSIYSEVKDSEDNTIRGIYMDTDGQVYFGDDNNFIRYYQQEDGTYKLAISADTILYDVNGVQYSISDLGSLGEYVKISTYEDEPCIELGEYDSDFKLLITNTKMIFREGTNILAYFNNQSLHIGKAVIEDELQQGGFVWKTRSNGNMGLVWKGVE